MRAESLPLYLVSRVLIIGITITIFLQGKSELLVAFPKRLCYIWFIQNVRAVILGLYLCEICFVFDFTVSLEHCSVTLV